MLRNACEPDMINLNLNPEHPLDIEAAVGHTRECDCSSRACLVLSSKSEFSEVFVHLLGDPYMCRCKAQPSSRSDGSPTRSNAKKAGLHVHDCQTRLPTLRPTCGGLATITEAPARGLVSHLVTPGAGHMMSRFATFWLCVGETPVLPVAPAGGHCAFAAGCYSRPRTERRRWGAAGSAKWRT